MKKCVKVLGKAVFMLAAFCLLFSGFQRLIIPKDDPTNFSKGLFELEKDSIDVLFLGASQVFCSVNGRELTENYDIPSYVFGGSGQHLLITRYYLEEALKTQHPKLVMLEVCSFFYKLAEIDDKIIGWNYLPMPLSIDKYRSLYALTNGDAVKSIQYCFPLLRFHSRWCEVGPEDVKYSLHLPSVYSDFSSRGHYDNDDIEAVEIKYLQNPAGGGGYAPCDSGGDCDSRFGNCEVVS